MTFSSFIAYLAILFVATVTPGPSMLLAINHGVNHGLSKTLYSSLGNLAGNLLMALVSILGLGAVLVASGVVFSVIKWIGVVYLITIGLLLIVKPGRESGKADLPRSNGQRHRLFIHGFIIALGSSFYFKFRLLLRSGAAPRQSKNSSDRFALEGYPKGNQESAKGF